MKFLGGTRKCGLLCDRSSNTRIEFIFEVLTPSNGLKPVMRVLLFLGSLMHARTKVGPESGLKAESGALEEILHWIILSVDGYPVGLTTIRSKERVLVLASERCEG